jgi:hypothetical protein
MATFEGGISGVLAGVDLQAAAPMHNTHKPIPCGLLGHYRTSHRCAIVASQAANAILFEFRNPHASNLCVITRVRIAVVQTGAYTAALETSYDMYRLTGHTAVATTQTVTPTVAKLRTSYGTAEANVRGLTVAGNSAGMTAGTRTSPAPRSAKPEASCRPSKSW